MISSDESGDEDYVGSDEEANQNGRNDEDDEEDEQIEVELSGSEDEETGSVASGTGLIDVAAEESEEHDNESEIEADPNSDEEEDEAPQRQSKTTRRRNVVVIDEDSDTESPQHPTPYRPIVHPSPTQQDDNMMAAFGFAKSPAALGMTQMFAGTMASLDEHPIDKEPEQDSLDFLRGLPETQPSNMFTQDQTMHVPNSQLFDSVQETPRSGPRPKLDLGLSQLIETSPAFSDSQDFEPTQDTGFGLSRTPAAMAPPPSTMETVMMTVAETPVAKKKGRLHQRRQTEVPLGRRG